MRRLQLQKTGPVRVPNVGNQKTHEPLVLCAFVAFETETSLALFMRLFIHVLRNLKRRNGDEILFDPTCACTAAELYGRMRAEL